jgi:hypothetical protein
MSSFSADISSETLLRGATSPITRRTLIDGEIERQRRQTPAEDLEQREVKRLSIAELNSLDIEQVRERLERSRPDSRTAFVRALDLIDLPRNAVANLISEVAAPGLKREKAQSGDRAAAGLPRIMFSDFLREAGVDNRVVRGIAGFVGDVALDPLTYLGGAGIGLKVTSKAGQSVQIGKAAGRGLRRAEKTLARGGTPSAGPAADLLKGVSLTTERIAPLRASRQAAGRTEKEIQNEIQSFIRKRTQGNLGEPGGRPGIIGRAVDDAQAVPGSVTERQLQAGKAFVAEGTPGARSTLRIGTGGQVGSQILRVPFTDIGIQGPAISRAAKTRQAQQLAAKSGTVSPLQPMFRGSAAATSISNQIRHMGDLRAELKQAENVIAAPEFAQLDEVNQFLAQSHAAGLKNQIDGLSTVARETAKRTDAALSLWRESRAAAHVAGRAGDDPATGLALAQQARKDRAMAELAAVEASEELSRARNALRERLQGLDGRLFDEEVTQRLAAIESPTPAQVAQIELDALTDIQSRLTDAQRNLSNMGDLDAEAGIRIADAAHARVTALHNAALASQSTVFELADSTDRALGRMVMNAMGGGPEQIGLATLAPMSAAVRGIVGDEELATGLLRSAEQVSKAGRQITGAPRGDLRSRAAAFLKAITTTSNDTLETVRRDFDQSMGTLVDPRGKYRIDPGSARQINDFAVASLYVRTLPENTALQQQAKWRPGQAAKYGSDINSVPDGELRSALSPVYARIVEFERAGIAARHPEAMSEILNPMVERSGRMLDEAGQASLDEHLLSDLIPGYIPLRLTQRGQKVASRTRRGGQGALATARKEFFQKQRSTHRYRFTDSTGTERDVFEFELAHYPSLTADELNDIKGSVSGSDFAKIEERIRIAKELLEQQKAGGLDEVTRRTVAVPADPFELNEQFRAGRFAPIATTIEAGNHLFEESLPVMMGARMAAQGRATASAQWQAHVARLGVPISEKVRPVPGKSAMTIGGAELRILPDRNAPGGYVARIGDTNYRRLNEKHLQGSPLLGDAWASSRDMLYPEQVAEVIENAGKALRGQDEQIAMVGALRQITTWWKATTLGHLSWSMMNFVGNTFQATVGSIVEGANPAATVASIGRNSQHLVKMTWHANDAGYMASHFIDIPGVGRRSYAQVHAELLEQGVIKSNSGSELLVQLFNEGIWRYHPGAVPSAQGLRGLPRRLKAEPRRVRDEFAQTVAANARAADRAEKPLRRDQIKAAGQTAVNQKMLARIYAPWFRVNQGAEDVMRAGMYLALREQGFDAAAAGKSTLRSMFDYQDLSHVENEWLRLFLPFYSWLRLSGGYYLHQMLENPALLAVAPKLKENLEEALVGEAAVPEHLRPSWMREQMAIQIAENPKSRQAIMSGTAWPTETALQVLSGVTGGIEGAQDFMHYMVSSLNPAIRGGAELATGQEFFTGRSIGPDEFSGDLSATEFVLGQVRPLREFGVGSQRISPLARAAESGVAGVAGRLALAGRIQNFDDERLHQTKLREFKDKETGIRRAISRAESNNRPSIEGRVRLLALYREMVESGFEADVPKWARETLAPAATR